MFALIGNEYIHLISSNSRHKIRFQLRKLHDTNHYADYSTFSIGDEANKYQLTVNGYSGTAGKYPFPKYPHFPVAVRISRLEFQFRQLVDAINCIDCYFVPVLQMNKMCITEHNATIFNQFYSLAYLLI